MHFGVLGSLGATSGSQNASGVDSGFSRIDSGSMFGSLWVPLGALRTPSGEPFRSLWPSRAPKKRKKRRFGGCLFAGPIFARIFFTFRVPWTPKTIDSVWERCTKPRFRPRPKKTRFRIDFGVDLKNNWGHVGCLWVTFGARGFLFCDFFRDDFPIDFFMDFGVPATTPEGTRRQRTSSAETR